MRSDLIRTGDKLLATTRDAWEEAMRPVADVRVQEVLGRQFSAELQLFELPRTAFFLSRFKTRTARSPKWSHEL